MTRLLACLFFLSLAFTARADDTPPSPRLKALEDSLKRIGPKVFKGKDEAKDEANKKFISFLREALQQPGAFAYPFDSLKFMARLTAPDQKFRLFNWNLPLADGTHQYFCFILMNPGKESQPVIHELTDKSDEIRSPETSTLSAEKWYGALYYRIILTQTKKEKYYTLLGWDGNNNMIWKKIIEVLTFRSDGAPVFGENALFDMGKISKRRIIFQYKAELVMTLRYEESDKLIVFDRLAPEIPNADGMYQFYTQTFSYDGFKFKKGKWRLQENVEAKNKKRRQDDKYNAPGSPDMNKQRNEGDKPNLGGRPK